MGNRIPLFLKNYGYCEYKSGLTEVDGVCNHLFNPFLQLSLGSDDGCPQFVLFSLFSIDFILTCGAEAVGHRYYWYRGNSSLIIVVCSVYIQAEANSSINQTFAWSW